MVRSSVYPARHCLTDVGLVEAEAGYGSPFSAVCIGRCPTSWLTTRRILRSGTVSIPSHARSCRITPPINLRMARARELLHTSFLSVKEIAAETPCSRVSGISTRSQAGRGRGERALTHCADAAMRPVRASRRSTITKVLKTRRDASAKIQLGATIIPLRSLQLGTDRTSTTLDRGARSRHR